MPSDSQPHLITLTNEHGSVQISCDVVLRNLSTQFDEAKALLRRAADGCQLALNAFEKSWAIDWAELERIVGEAKHFPGRRLDA